MLQYLTGGQWGVVIRRPLEAATRTLPLLVLLFIPLAFGMQGLYARAQRPRRLTRLQLHKILSLHQVCSVASGDLFCRMAVVGVPAQSLVPKQDGTTDQRWSRRLQTLSGPGLVVYGFTATFAGIDWVMSLQADWNSTIFGMLVMGSQVLSALAFIVIVSVVLGASPPSLKFSRPNTFTIWGSCS